MPDIKKHIGILTNTGTRVVVVFRELPEEPTSCLVVEPDRLPDLLHDSLMELVNSRDASQTNDFYDVLNRRQFADGTHALSELHRRQLMRKVPVENVNMEPMPGRTVPLSMVNEQIAGKTVVDPNAKPKNEVNPDNAKATAESLMMQAEMLIKEAADKREEAYKLYPELRPEEGPKKNGRPELSPEEKALRDIEKKDRRRERDREKAATKKASAEQAALDQAVNDKILRDAERKDSE